MEYPSQELCHPEKEPVSLFIKALQWKSATISQMCELEVWNISLLETKCA